MTRRCASGSSTSRATRKVSAPRPREKQQGTRPSPRGVARFAPGAEFFLPPPRGGVQRHRPHLEVRLQPVGLPQQDHLRRGVVRGGVAPLPSVPFGFGGSGADPLRCPPAGATSPGRWPRPVATTPSGSSRRAPRPRRSSPPSASPPTCPARTRRTSTAWPGTPRSRGCWPPAATTARSPSGSTSSLKCAESPPQRFQAAVPATKPLVEESRTGPGWATSCIPPPCSTWTSALWQPAAGGFGGARKEPASRGGPAALPRDTHSGAAPCQAQGDTPRALLLPPALCSINPHPAQSLRLFLFGAVTAPPGPGGSGAGCEQQGRV